MVDADQLNEWQDPDYPNSSIEQGRPQWFKIWAEKYADALDIEHLDEDLDAQEKDILFREVGKAFINSLFYFMANANEASQYSSYRPSTRDGRIIWNALKRDIDQSFRDYFQRVENGAKGGRPRKQ